VPAFIKKAVLDEFDARAEGFEAERFEPAKAWLQSTAATLRRAHLNIGFDFPAIDERANDLAARSRRLRDHDLIKRLADDAQLTLPLGNRESTDESIALRCGEAKTWRKSMEKNYTRKAENKLREIGFIEKGGMLYCSDLAVAWYRGKIRAQEAWLHSRMVASEGVQLELWEVAQKSLSNKSNRRTELMTRMRGFEDYAAKRSDVGVFITATCPSRFHARTVRGGLHERYDYSTIRDGQQWLSQVWARSRAACQRQGITIYGFRIAEPHHDGTPHWHLVLFCAPSHLDALQRVLRSKWLSVDADEPGADVHRIRFKNCDPKLGTASGYIAKYIAKNIDGFETGELTSDEDQKTTLQKAALRVTAWASLHGIRQFQQIGGPAIGVYRELRRERNPVNLPTIEPARAACDAHEFGRFIEINGGVDCGRHGNIRSWREAFDARTGEIPQNVYGEQRPPRVVGVMSVSEALETRSKTWRIVRKTGVRSTEGAIGQTRADEVTKTWESAFSDSGLSQNSALGPVSITVPGQGHSRSNFSGGPSLSDPFGWTNPRETSMYGPH
jgi:hypothetical protein